jgi:hypothetical protein
MHFDRDANPDLTFSQKIAMFSCLHKGTISPISATKDIRLSMILTAESYIMSAIGLNFYRYPTYDLNHWKRCLGQDRNVHVHVYGYAYVHVHAHAHVHVCCHAT